MRCFTNRGDLPSSCVRPLGEVVATAGLVLVIFGLTRAGRHGLVASAVGAYIGAAYWFTSTTSFANPAVTIGRIFSDTFAGIAPASSLGFIAAQLVGGAICLAVTTALFPNGAVEVLSGGSEPGDQINPIAVEAMAEEGIDISEAVPQLMSIEQVRESDVVITMGCGDVCPIFPGKRPEDWELTDPKGKPIEEVRVIRDEIRGRVVRLLAGLQVGRTYSPTVA